MNIHALHRAKLKFKTLRIEKKMRYARRDFRKGKEGSIKAAGFHFREKRRSEEESGECGAASGATKRTRY